MAGDPSLKVPFGGAHRLRVDGSEMDQIPRRSKTFGPCFFLNLFVVEVGFLTFRIAHAHAPQKTTSPAENVGANKHFPDTSFDPGSLDTAIICFSCQEVPDDHVLCFRFGLAQEKAELPLPELPEVAGRLHNPRRALLVRRGKSRWDETPGLGEAMGHKL